MPLIQSTIDLESDNPDIHFPSELGAIAKINFGVMDYSQRYQELRLQGPLTYRAMVLYPREYRIS